MKIGERTRGMIVNTIAEALEDHEAGLSEAFKKGGGQVSVGVTINVEARNAGLNWVEVKVRYTKEKVSENYSGEVAEEQLALFGGRK